MVGFVPLRNFKDSRFCSTRYFKDGQFCFVLFQEFNDGQNICKKFTKFQRWLVLLGYEILVTVGFVLYEISKMVSFVFLQEFNDGRNLLKKI